MLIQLAERLLSYPPLYTAYQSMVGAPACHAAFIRDHVRPRPGERILDIGCGTGASLDYLPRDITYVGIDIDPGYVAMAQSRHPGRGTFLCGDATTLDLSTYGPFDRIFMFGVLHHLPDEAVERLAGALTHLLKPGGHFASIDPCYVAGQPLIARFLVDHDRGRHVRQPERYGELLRRLGTGRHEVFHDLLRVPYSQVVHTVEYAGSMP